MAEQFLSLELRAVVTTLAADATGLTDRTWARIRQEIPAYGGASGALLVEIQRNIEDNARLWYRAVLRGVPATVEELDQTIEFARRRVHQGVPLPSLLQAFRIGSAIVWECFLEAVEKVPDVQREALFKVSPLLVQQVDLTSQSIGQAYVDEAAREGRWRDRTKQELGELLLSSDPDVERFDARVSVLAIDPDAPYCTLVAGPTTGVDGELQAVVGRAPTAAAKALGVSDHSVIETTRDDRVVLWVPATHPERLEAAARSVQAALGASYVGVGTPDVGLHGWASSARQASRALELGRQLRPQEVLHRYADVAVYDIALRTPEVARFLGSLLDRISSEPVLLASLEAYFGGGRHLKAAAATLGVHTNTVSYRLRRIEVLLGGRFDDTEWTLHLLLALRLHQFRHRLD